MTPRVRSNNPVEVPPQGHAQGLRADTRSGSVCPTTHGLDPVSPSKNEAMDASEQVAHATGALVCDLVPVRKGRFQDIEITKELMLIQTRSERIDIQQIANRRFMFNPKTGELVLGKQYSARNCLVGTHAEELGDAGARGNYDDFLRGWIGTDKKQFRNGVIHFAPPVDVSDPDYYDAGFQTIEMFQRNGATESTILRGFGRGSEVSIEVMFSPAKECGGR